MLPFFYCDIHHAVIDEAILLPEDTSKHCIQVLRMHQSEQLWLTNGKGQKYLVEIIQPDKKHCQVKIIKSIKEIGKNVRFALAIAFTKNNSRNEWLLEKVSEMGISDIFPIITQRSERSVLKYERLNTILVSAMLQSQQTFLPALHQAASLKDFLNNSFLSDYQKFIAHCIDKDKRHFAKALESQKNTIVCIGPEGDFTEEEIALCLQHQFVPVSLGNNRLRTETAGLYVCTLFNALNDE